MPPAYVTVNEVAEMTGLSRNTVMRIFEKEPGVLILERPETMNKRGYRLLRIPRPILDRVISRLSVRK